MKFIHQLILRRVTSPEQLSYGERQRLAGQPELQATLDENRALAAAARPLPSAPLKDAMLSQVYERAANSKEKPMTLINRLFAGRPWYARLALACLILLALVAAGQLLPTRGLLAPGPKAAYAATDGYMLVFDFGDKTIEQVQPTLDELKKRVQLFKEEQGLQVEDATWANKMGVISQKRVEKTEAHDGSGAPKDVPCGQLPGENRLTAFVSLENAELLDELKTALSGISGLPEPQVVDATWFNKQGLPLPGKDGIRLNLGIGGKEHVFNFPPDATEEEIQQAVLAWLKESNPDANPQVEVKITKEGEQRKVTIKISKEQE